MSDAIFRYLLLLREIPASPHRIDTCTLAARLEAQGVRVTMRTLQRDLERLSRRLPLICHDQVKPYAWTWVETPTAGNSSSRETLRDVAVRTAKHLTDRKG